jgi:signal transduction histidine kinase
LLELQSKGRQNNNGGSVQSSVEAQIRALIDQVRQMAGQLRPAILDDFGLESALARKFKDMSGLKGILIDYQSVSSIEDKKRLPAAVEVGLYRVAIEAVENAVSHSAASHVSVVVHWQEGKVTLLVEDDGRGFDYPSVRRDMDRCKGLIEMEETLRIVTSPEKGTIVRAEVPADTVQ